MKKKTAVILLIIGSVLVWTTLWIGNYFLYLIGEISFGVALPIVVLITATFGIDCLRRLFLRKYLLGTGWFMLCAYAPAAGWAIPVLIISLSHRDFKYDWFMSGFTKAYEQVYTYVAAAAILGGALLWLGISSIICKQRKKP